MAFNVRGSDYTRILKKNDLPYEQIKLENVVITMRDGCKLYANIWIPKNAFENKIKVGALLEYIPYRKNDNTSMRDSIRHPYYAGHGLASIRVDMRGSGDSDDVLYDEYLKQEQDDCLEVFDWIIRQTWSNGNVGMFGKSWGGFNSLQVAARQHPALKAIITLMSTDDRYADDVHYRGGCLLASDMVWWGSTMFAYNARPQDPQIVGSSWKENWFKRLEVSPFWKKWLKHQTRDDYWKHGSICEDYSKITIPVLAIGGWRDGYTSSVFRLCKNLRNSESAGIIGPWVHEYPEVAEPSPKIGYQQLSLKWFKRFLVSDSGESNETLSLPKLTAYIQDPTGIDESYKYRKGKWISTFCSEEQFCSLNLTKDRRLSTEEAEDFQHQFSGTLDYGMFRGTWCPFGFKGDFPTEQRLEDEKSFTYDSEIAEKDYCFLGEPELSLKLSADKTLANISVRVTDVYPNGESILITWGMLNLTHRDSHEFPKKLEIDKMYDIVVKLDVLGITLKKGHKLRLALSATDWPQQWPSPEIPTLTVYSGVLRLPLLDDTNVLDAPNFDKPTIMKECETVLVEPYARRKKASYDYTTGSWVIEDVQDSGVVLLPSNGSVSGIEFGSVNTNIWKCLPNDPLSAYNECSWCITFSRANNWKVKIETVSRLTCDEQNFYLCNKLIAYEDDIKVKEILFQDTILRQFI